MKKINNVLWGIILIIIGIIFALNSLEITNINLFFKGWWTLFIIIPSLIDVVSKESKTGSIIGLVIGVALLFACRGLIDFTLVLKLIVPVIIIIFGLSLIFKDSINKKVKEEIKKLGENEKKEYYATFSNHRINIEQDSLNSEANAIFGGLTIDLMNTEIKEDIIINANAIFGSITILIPKNVNIKISSTPIFGNISNEIKNNHENKITVYINALALFGGIEVK